MTGSIQNGGRRRRCLSSLQEECWTNQCCGSGSVRIRTFRPDTDPIRNRNQIRNKSIKRSLIFRQNKVVSYDYTYFTDKIYYHIYVTDSWVLRVQPKIHRHSVDRVLGFVSSRPNWGSPTPSPAGECVLPSFGSAGGGVTHSLWERGWGGPNPTRGQTLWF